MHSFQDVQGCAHAHEVSGTVFRQERGRERADIFTLIFFFSHGKPSDGESIKRHFDQSTRAFASEVWIERTLDNGEERLWRVLPRRETPRCPAPGDLKSRACRFLICRRGDALVQHHHDVTADRALRLDTHLWAQQNPLPVHVTLKNGSLLGHVSRVGKGENLIPAGVGQHRFLPAHEAVNAAHPLEDFRPWSEQQMIGVSQQDLRSGGSQRLRELCFYGGLGSDRHEDRCAHFIVQSRECGRPCLGAGRSGFNLEMKAGGGHFVLFLNPFRAPSSGSFRFGEFSPEAVGRKFRVHQVDPMYFLYFTAI